MKQHDYSHADYVARYDDSQQVLVTEGLSAVHVHLAYEGLSTEKE